MSCDWCEGGACDLVWGDGFYAEIDNGELVVSNSFAAGEGRRKINFCPMCGKALEGGGGPEPNYDDTTLVELIRRASKTHNLNIEAEDAESLGDEMYDAMFDGVDTVEGIVALLHTAAIQAAEMRNRLEKLEAILGDEYDLDRLAAYEDTGLEPEEIAKIREDVETGYLKSTARRYGIPVDRLRELAKADREGRGVVLPCKPSDVTVYQLRNKKHARGVGISPRHVGSASVWGDGHYALDAITGTAEGDRS